MFERVAQLYRLFSSIGAVKGVNLRTDVNGGACENTAEYFGYKALKFWCCATFYEADYALDKRLKQALLFDCAETKVGDAFEPTK